MTAVRAVQYSFSRPVGYIHYSVHVDPADAVMLKAVKLATARLLEDLGKVLAYRYGVHLPPRALRSAGQTERRIGCGGGLG